MHYKINHIAVWLAIVLQVGLSALWYSPLVFGEQWLSALGMTMADLDLGDYVPYLIAVGGTVLLTYFLAWLVVRLEATYPSEAVQIAFLLWLCVVVTEHATHYTFQGVDYRVLLIDTGKTLVGLLIAALLLVSWRRRAV